MTRLTAAELAARVGDPVDRVADLTARGDVTSDADGRYAPGRTLTGSGMQGVGSLELARVDRPKA